MMNKYFIAFVLFLTCLSAKAQTITLATYQYADNDRLANIQPLADFLKEKCHVNVKVKSYPTVHLFIQALQNNEVDIALINTFGYLLLGASPKKCNTSA